MSLTTDPNDPRLGRGIGDNKPVPQNEVYLVLSEEERSKGFIRPYRDAYDHVGPIGPKFPIQDLTEEQQRIFVDKDDKDPYVKYEKYPEGSNGLSRFWTQKDLDSIGKGCRTVTTMGRALSETYARNPKFYGATYCCGCSRHLPVEEFVWTADNKRVGS